MPISLGDSGEQPDRIYIGEPGGLFHRYAAVYLGKPTATAELIWGTLPVPGNLVLSIVNRRQIRGTWDAVLDAAGYDMDVRPTGTTPWTTQQASTNSATTGNLSYSTSYDVRVKARHAVQAMDSGYTDTQAISTQAGVSPPPPPPPPPPGPEAPGIPSLIATVSGRTVSGTIGISARATTYSYRYRAGDSGDWTTSAFSSTRTFSFEGDWSTTYQVEAAARGTGGTSDYGSRLTVSIGAEPTQAPATPGLTSSIVGRQATWLAGSVATAAGYRFQRRTGTTGTGTQVQSGASRTYSFQGDWSTTYQVRVQAFNAAGDSGWSEWVSGTIGAEPTQPPATPGDPASSVSGQRVTWTWNAAARATSYEYQQRTGTSGLPGGVVSTGTARSHTFSGLWNTTYQIRVRARNSAGVSGWSSWVSGTIGAQPVLQIPTLSVSVSGRAVSGTIGAVAGATGYRARYRAGTSGAWTSLVVSATRTISFTGAFSTSYQVEAQAFNASGSSGWRRATATIGADVPVPDPPAFTVTRTTAPPTRPVVTITAVTGATKYEVQWATRRREVSGGTIVNLGTRTSWTGPSRAAFYARVRVTTAGGTSSWSSIDGYILF